jgi:hypothetical protein
MKFIGWLLGIIVIVVAAVYTIAFTSFGNGIVQPRLQEKLQEALHQPVKVQKFVLTTSKIALDIRIDTKNIIQVSGNYSFFSDIALRYNIVLDKLESFSKLAKMQLHGALQTSGTVTGQLKNLHIDGSSDVAGSDTAYHAVIANYAPKSAAATIMHMQLSKILYMIGQPHYADALIGLNANIPDLNHNHMSGTVKMTIDKGLLDTQLVSKMYKFKDMPRITFHAATNSVLIKNLIHTKVDFFSTLADLHVKDAQFNTKEGTLLSDYSVKIPNLAKLFFVTHQKMQGAFAANGTVQKAKTLSVTMHTGSFGGSIDAKYSGQTLAATLRSVKTLPVLKMLTYPAIFDSNIDAKLNYNIAKQWGTLSGKVQDGRFTKNTVFDLLGQYAKFDLYKERFSGDITSKITSSKTLSSIALRSNNVSIGTKNMMLDSKTQKVGANIDLTVNKNPVTVTLSGAMKKPKVSIDASKLLKQKAKKAIENQLKKQMPKKQLNQLLKMF